MFEHILLAVDGSEQALRAAKIAGELARAVHAKEFRIVIAYEPVPVYLGEPNLQNTINARLNESQATLKEAQEAVGEVPIEVHTEMLEGQTAETILNVANTYHSEVIVMGSRGLGRLTGALLGSNSQKVVSEARCPVLIVK